MSLNRSLCRVVLALLAVVAAATPAAAQFRPPADPATGESYHIEAACAFWNATPTLIVSSEALGIPGTDVDLVTDLGIEKKSLRDLRLVLRPATKHKFRFSYIPIKYEAEATVKREFVFNGQRYRVGLPVQTTADLTTLRVGYEYDFLYRDSGIRRRDPRREVHQCRRRAQQPHRRGVRDGRSRRFPTIGVVGPRLRLPRNVSITGEVTYFRVPDNLGGDDFGGRYIDFDFYGTVNFNDNVGAQVGYRSIDVNYFQELDAGTLRFKGLYFGGVVRY